MIPEGYRLVFEDDFNGKGLPDPKNWKCENGDRWANNEQQAYVESEKNAFVKDSVLTLRSLKEKWGIRDYTSGRITTAGRHSWTYGYFEFSAKLPTGSGSWPAIWMLPDDIGEVGWPRCGEIDILEHIGRKQDDLWYSLHCHEHNHTRKDTKQYTTIVHHDGVSEGFHRYALEWTKDHIRFLFDDKEECVYKRTDDPEHMGEDGWPFDKPYHLILNIAVGGGLGGEIDEETLPYEMQVEYVKVYQKQ